MHADCATATAASPSQFSSGGFLMSDQLAHLRQPSDGSTDISDGSHPRRKQSFRLEVLIGLILISGGVVGAFWLRQAGSSTTQVIGVVRDLPAGYSITDSDLFVVDVDQDIKDQFVAAELRPTMSGSVLTSDVVAGPIARAALQRSEQVLREGEALIATAMEEGTFPPSLMPGDVVAIVTTPSAAALDGEVFRVPVTAIVFAVSPANEFSAKTVVTLRAQQEVAEKVAASGPVHLSILKIGGAQ
jgi:hypothetical protein